MNIYDFFIYIFFVSFLFLQRIKGSILKVRMANDTSAIKNIVVYINFYHKKALSLTVLKKYYNKLHVIFLNINFIYATIIL